MFQTISPRKIDIAKSEIETVLIYRLGSLGDTVVALPCFHAIARAFPNHNRIVLTNKPVMRMAAPVEAILGPSGLIHGSIDYQKGMRSIKSLWYLRKSIRRTRARTLVYVTPPRGLDALRRDIIFFRLCGLKEILCAPSNPDTQGCRQLDDGQLESESERLVRCCASLGPIDLADRSLWDLRLTDEEKHAADVALTPLSPTPFFAINMGGKEADKQWGDENWTALLTALKHRLDKIGVVAVGATEDFARSSATLEAWQGPTLNLCGTLKPRETAAVLGQARAFVGHDSGPMHLAAASGTPTVGLFGNSNRPRQWHPYGTGHRPIHNMSGVRAIAVSQVHDAVVELIFRQQPETDKPVPREAFHPY